MYAARALGNLGDSQAVPALCAALSDPNVYVRWNVARSLFQIGDLRAVAALCHACTDGDVGVRNYASTALAKLGTPRELPYFTLASPDLTAHEKYAALVAMSEVRSGRRYRYPVGNVQNFCTHLAVNRLAAPAVRAGAVSVLEASNYLRASSAPEDTDTLLRPAHGIPNPTDAEELLRAIDPL